MKGFIEVTTEWSDDKILIHYTSVFFIILKNGQKIATHNGRNLKESYDQIKELIKQATT